MRLRVCSVKGDICDLEHLKEIFAKVRPEIVIHMAAQPLVRESYQRPVDTYAVNVMGTVNVLECIRLFPCVKSFVNVTTDKVYKNKEWIWGYREEEELNGYDPYSNSKSCSELVTDSYRNSFFQEAEVAVSTVRAGNVIGGGDFAKDRIIPDCIRAAEKQETIFVRNPYSVRPYQHVLEPVLAYLILAKVQYEDRNAAGSYNIGPEEKDCCTTGRLVALFCEKWKEHIRLEAGWTSCEEKGPHEAGYLKLDCSKIKERLKWRPVWHIDTAMDKIVQWYGVYAAGKDIWSCMESQVMEYINQFVEDRM